MTKDVEELLLKIATTLEKLEEHVRYIAKSMGDQCGEDKRETKARKQKVERGPEVQHISEIGEKLRNSSREEAKALLEQMNHENLGQIYAAFGASRDRKKPKSWLIEQILWHYFDFQEGHRILRDD